MVLDWDCQQIVSYNTVLELFMAQGVLYTSDKVNLDGSSTSCSLQLSHLAMSDYSRRFKDPDDSTTVAIEKCMEFFSLLCLQEVSFFNENQYCVACAIVSASRMHCHVEPIWSQELVQLTGLQHHHFLNVQQKI